MDQMNQLCLSRETHSNVPNKSVPKKTAALVFLTLKDGVGFQHLLFNPGVLATDGSQKLQDQLGALGLPCSRLTTAKLNIQVNIIQKTASGKISNLHTPKCCRSVKTFASVGVQSLLMMFCFDVYIT